MKVGDEVIANDEILDVFNEQGVISEIKFGKDSKVLGYHVNIIINDHKHELYFYPEELRPLTKLEKVLK